MISLRAEQDYVRENYRLTLDEDADYKVINSIYNNFKSDEVIDVLKAYDFLDKNPAVYKINKSVIQKSQAIELLKRQNCAE